MRNCVWFVRLIFAAWMIPAGINHFFRLFPQPMGNEALSTEVITALIDTGLFNIVKAVELLAGLSLLFGFRVPLMLVVLLPVSFNVWYWDTALQGWWTVSAVYGWAVLLCNLSLLAAYWRCYQPLFTRHAVPRVPGITAEEMPRLHAKLRA